jgi:hypothetical protein
MTGVQDECVRLLHVSSMHSHLKQVLQLCRNIGQVTKSRHHGLQKVQDRWAYKLSFLDVTAMTTVWKDLSPTLVAACALSRCHLPPASTSMGSAYR